MAFVSGMVFFRPASKTDFSAILSARLVDLSGNPPRGRSIRLRETVIWLPTNQANVGIRKEFGLPRSKSLK
jgi:hypothetical protein